ncbi:hypothetical protein P3T76_013589 [Phytophthora citrophthora]|uniref:Uncharacterized protein n=1 Tax=Phytophthora citrophthora TaxID=4793 RepID=A0AAD9G3J6_9STRA|nr:hypothetical protein P3T76_013589 [Phytophthora citrophthora]
MHVGGRLLHPRVKLRAHEHRVYRNQELNDSLSSEEKQTQTELTTSKTHFVTPRLVLSSQEASDTPFGAAFSHLCQLVRSAEWKHSLLLVLGHDPDKRRDELERKIREDEASEAIDNNLRVFFDSVLAPLIQDRETALVNAIHECVQLEMQTQQVVIESQQQRTTQLTQQLEDREKQVTHLKSKVDRRVTENNALRKEQYRQLLMLRDIMSKQGSDPGGLMTLNEAIAGVLAGKQQAPVPESNDEQSVVKNSGRWMAMNANMQVLHREKEKWEQRAREATSECQELRDELARLTQENVNSRSSEVDYWFLKPENAIAERQRIADAVSSYQGNWEGIGDSLVELLNNDILWAAVEQSARRGGKRRIARGLEAVLTQMDNWIQPSSIKEEAAEDKSDNSAIPLLVRRHSTFAELGRLIPCRTCVGVGYIHADKEDDGGIDSDTYLRKTLEQVLELKTQLENASSKTLALEGQLQLSNEHTTQLEEKIHKAELIKSTAVDSGLQTDLDDEEGIDIDEIMRSAYDQESPATDKPGFRSRQKLRNTQYEHLIVELKNALADKDEGLMESRKALDVAQARAVALQRAVQKEKDSHAQELTKLKTSLAFSLKTRNSEIEERQAAVKLLMKNFTKKSPQIQSAKRISVSLSPPEDSEEDDVDEMNDTVDLAGNEPDEVKRMEALVQRYGEDIIRVRKEHETQQELLNKAEAEVAEEEAKRSRTNSISQGHLVVNVASHPRDLFKALSTAQADMLKLRRSSQRSSALQTDRLLTLTRHLGHMSEELCTLRKRNVAELEFWKLECEKLQNSNKALEAEQQIVRKQLQDVHSRKEVTVVAGACTLCEKHKKRLMQISNELLNQAQTDPEVEVPSSVLTESERKMISSALLDLESLYTGMSAAKQQFARDIVSTHLGNALKPSSSRRTTIDLARSPIKATRTNLQGKEGGSSTPRSASNSLRRSLSPIKTSKSSRQLKQTEGVSNELNEDQSPTRASTTAAEPPKALETEQSTANEAPTTIERVPDTIRRKTLVQEILEGGGISLAKLGLTSDKPVEVATGKNEELLNYDKESDNNAETDQSNSNDSKLKGQTDDEPEDDDKHNLTLKLEGISMINGSSDGFQDPDVIKQLRQLINASGAAKERLVMAKWQILTCRMLLLAGEHRLDQVSFVINSRGNNTLIDAMCLKFLADKRARIYPDGSLRPASLRVINICDAMIKVVQQRKRAEAIAFKTQEVSRLELQKAQKLLINGVAMLLDSLNRKGKPKIELNELLYLYQGSSPRRSPTNRPLYPSTKVYLSDLPQTQQISTSTFPTLDRNYSKDQVRPSSSRSSGEESAEVLTHGEGYHLPRRLIRSAGPRPFTLVHSSIGALQGSIPFPDPAHIRNFQESEEKVNFRQQRPARPHSSPAGPRFMSPRTQGLVSSTSSLQMPEKIAENEADV